MSARSGAGAFHYDWTWHLPADPQTLWPLVSDTDAFNRDTGLPAVRDAGEPGEELEEARRKLRFSLHGFTVEWREQPFEWVRPHRFGVVREYTRGPLAEMRIRAELTPDPEGGTRLSYRVAARPANLLGRLLIPLQIGFLSRRLFGKVFREYGRRAGQAPPGVASSPLRELGGDRRRLGGVVDALADAGVDGEVARALAGHLAAGDARSVSRIRPFVLADVWGCARRAVLEACLHATRSGYLTLRWNVLCPLCRGVKEGSERLEELRLRGIHCDTCRIDFSADFTESVELTFVPSPSLRRVEEQAFCVAGPQVTPHIVAQQLLAPDEERTLRPVLEPGRYRLRRHGRTDGPALTVDAGAREPHGLRFGLGRDGWSGSGGTIGTNPELTIANETGTERLVVLERTSWADDTVTAAEVTRMQTFRDLFSAEVLAAGDFVEVGTLTVLFTDLKGSTRLYRDIGDAPAFGRIMEHFDLLRAAVTGHGGTVVKTIGDAVMAVFDLPESAVAAALDACVRLEEAQGLVLKAGVHTGPCLTVTLNGRLDYFGTTVNRAARLESLSRGGEVVISETVLTDPAVAELLRESDVAVDTFEATLRGLEDVGPSRVARVSRPPLTPPLTPGRGAP